MTRHVSARPPAGVDLSTNSHDAGASAAQAVVETAAEHLRRTLPETIFSRRQRDEIAKARRNHPDPVLSLHEGYAILLEEVDELWDLVRQRAKNRSRAAVLDELVQVAAMAQRIAEDLEFVQGLDEPTTYQRIERRAETAEGNLSRVRLVCEEQRRELTVLAADLRQARSRLPIRGANVRAKSRKGNSLAPGGRSGGTPPRVAASGLTGASDSPGARRKATAAKRPTPRKGVRR